MVRIILVYSWFACSLVWYGTVFAFVVGRQEVRGHQTSSARLCLAKKDFSKRKIS